MEGLAAGLISRRRQTAAWPKEGHGGCEVGKSGLGFWSPPLPFTSSVTSGKTPICPRPLVLFRDLQIRDDK